MRGSEEWAEERVADIFATPIPRPDFRVLPPQFRPRAGGVIRFVERLRDLC